MTLRRPALRYYGGKWKLAGWLIANFPPHRIYVEPFGGGASVLLQKPRSYAEVYNDLDGEIVNVFEVLRCPTTAVKLERALRLTPFSRTEFVQAYRRSRRPVEQARRTIIKSFMGFGSSGIYGNSNRGMRTRASVWGGTSTGFRNNSSRSGTTPAHDWGNYPDQISEFCERLQGVVIENKPAALVTADHDRDDALHYLDPPYPKSTRGSGRHEYRFEFTDKDHCELAQQVKKLRGMVVISGYPCDLYDRDLYRGWLRLERPHLADGAKKSTEVLWMNDAAATYATKKLFAPHCDLLTPEVTA